jgi:hypothetical protein
MGKLLKPFGRMSMNFANMELSLRTSSMQKVAKKECFGDMSLVRKFLDAISEPIGDAIARSRVIS